MTDDNHVKVPIPEAGVRAVILIPREDGKVATAVFDAVDLGRLRSVLDGGGWSDIEVQLKYLK